MMNRTPETSPPLKRGVLGRLARWGLVLIVGSALAIGLAAGSLYLLRSKWDLRGNFTPVFDFSSPDRRLQELERHRAAQREGPLPTAEAADETLEGWPSFRGPRRDGVSEATGLLSAWPADGLRPLYRQPVGGGYSGFALGLGRAYTLEQRGGEEAVVAYDFLSGVELWSFSYPAYFQEQMGGDGPRATPTLDDRRLYALGAQGHLNCLDALTGELVWARHLLRETNSGNLTWGMSGSPLIEGDRLWVTASGLGGPGVLVFEKATGEPVGAYEPGRQQAYASLEWVELVGRPVLLDFAAEALVGLDPETGRRLWSFDWTGPQNGINAAQPLFIGPDRVFISSGYGQGCAMIEIGVADGPEGPQWNARRLWSNVQMKNKFNSSVHHEGFIYGLDEGVLACLDARDGRRRWKGGRYGYGQLLLAEGHLIVLGESGELALVRATPRAFEEVSRFKAIDGKTWNHPALAGGRLLIRNGREMACFDLRAEAGS